MEHPMQATTVTQAQDRQHAIDVQRAVALLAGELEEMADSGADLDLVIGRLRTRVRMAGLTPVGQAGLLTRFDPTQHDAPGERPAPGTPVVVARPGYASMVDGESLVIERAVVATV
jgi:hypothetical protein